MADSDLRERVNSKRVSAGETPVSTQGQAKAEKGRGDDMMKERKTFGRTPEGIIFTVPQTHDMVSQLLSPSQPKNFGDIIVLAILGLHILTLYLLPTSLRIPAFAVLFLLWRACYNGGIGYLLHIQSKHQRLVTWAKKLRLFVNPTTGENPHPMLYYFIKSELEKKITEDYKFEEAPIEYNTWLVFRRIVDLILMCDFVSYCLFAIACGERPVDEGILMTLFRWTAGWSLISFNLWVKLDAHRVVKDYAWYWGDFFYLIDQELVWDGAFLMAPHPMYSIGYAGYYGISLITASYNVLFISIIAHICQFAFLIWVENPHIEKTYSSPTPRMPTLVEPAEEGEIQKGHANGAPPLASAKKPSLVHNLVGLQNIDLYRTTDTSVMLLLFYLVGLALLTPSTTLYQALFVVHATIWRLWYSLGIGFILNGQSTKKRWTRHFVKYGESTEEAWRQWKGIYHLSMTMCYASFIAAAWKLYELPPDWSHGMALLKHVIGIGLVSLQIWTAVSIYESLGEFGWFFGDFFFDHAPVLNYSGIYRFLNNPERVIGLAGVWGAVIITGSSAMFFLAALSHISSLAIIHFVERKHMQKVYGQSLRSEAGLVKSLKQSLPPPLRQWQGSMDKIFSETIDFVEELLDSAQPIVAEGMRSFVKDSTALFKQPTRITITRLEPDLANHNPRDYSVEVEGTPLSALFVSERVDRQDTLMFEYGAPIRVRWRAPVNHSKKDWIGLYMVADNTSREVTRVASRSRWIATNPDQYDSVTADDGILTSDVFAPSTASGTAEGSQDYLTGEMEFSKDKLWWTSGVFEFRYHHNGKHNVMAISKPFEVKIGEFDENDVEADANGLVRGAVEEMLLPLVRNCFDRDPEIAPQSTLESFGSLVERDGKYARRVVYVVRQMFGIEFAPEVVKADGNVKNLAWRICNAKMVLAPYSMSSSKGNTTPTSSEC